MESFNYAVLDSYVLFLQRAAHEFGVQCSGRYVSCPTLLLNCSPIPSPCYSVALPTHKHKFTVLKSPHVYKKHRAQVQPSWGRGMVHGLILRNVQFDLKTHKRLIQVSWTVKLGSNSSDGCCIVVEGYNALSAGHVLALRPKQRACWCLSSCFLGKFCCNVLAIFSNP
jgi:ribosomal protein S10